MNFVVAVQDNGFIMRYDELEFGVAVLRTVFST